MNNMHWDEATQTWSGHAEPWLMNQEPTHYNGWNKPLLVPNEWLTPVAAQPLHNVWLELQRQALGVGGQDLVIYPMTDTPQNLQGALLQLVQAMAAFDAPLGSGMVLDEQTRAQLEPALAAAWHTA